MQINKQTIATIIAVIFHVVGLAGIFFFDRQFILKTTPLHLLLMCGLIFYSAQKIDKNFLLFFITCFIAGLLVEIIGTSTGLLFGNYHYGDMLGPGIKAVPFIIGINWFLIVYCCGISVGTVFRKLAQNTGQQELAQSPRLKFLSVVIDGATLAVFFDWIMEPAAIKLGYWKWQNDQIPLFNYACWFLVSALLLMVFQLLNINRPHKFAVHLLLIQLMFFLLIRTFL